MAWWHISPVHIWWYQGQGRLPSSGLNNKVTLFKKRPFSGTLVFHKYVLFSCYDVDREYSWCTQFGCTCMYICQCIYMPVCQFSIVHWQLLQLRKFLVYLKLINPSPLSAGFSHTKDI